MRIHSFKRIIKIAISSAYFLFSSLVQSGLRMIGRPPQAGLVVLYYHGVPAKYRLNFKRQMDALQRGANVVPASYRGRLATGKKYVAITFDDAFDNLIDNALPELLVRTFDATIFVPVGSIGSRPTWKIYPGDDLDASDTVMTVEQLRELRSPFITLGSHSVSHPLMSELNGERLCEEVQGSRSRLEALVGREVRSFSFPYGDHSASCVTACMAAGYESIFSIVPERIDTTSSQILRGRTKVDPSDGPIEFFLKFSGGYQWVGPTTILLRKLRFILRPGRGFGGKFKPHQLYN
jgi:peptidoglycan/xylan/chitin deacetylase (PgdA/CDA1 family)